MTQYCSIDNIKNSGRLNISGSTYDSDLISAAEAISRRIDEWYGLVANSFAQSISSTRYFDDDCVDGDSLYLDHPIISIDSITDGQGNSVASANYRLHPRNAARYSEVRLLSTADSWAFDTDGEIAVVGKWGYSASPPADIAEACAYWTAYLFKRWQAALQDATANQDLGQLVYVEQVPKQVRALLKNQTIGMGYGA
jgi:hypothetical protein